MNPHIVVKADKDSAIVDKDDIMLPVLDELSLEQLEDVRGGMSPPRFEMWCCRQFNGESHEDR